MKTDLPTVTTPFFLVGSERSGTTLLRLMLDHHPAVAWCSEFEYIVDRVSANDEWPSLDRYYEWLETHRNFQNTGFKIDRTLNYPQLVNSFLCQKLKQEGKPLVGATVHRHFDKLTALWPNARFIHLRRDGRDVARSCIGMGWAGNVWTGVENWIEAESLWANFNGRIPPERKIELSFENLIRDHVKTLTRLCDFIGVPYDAAMLHYAKTSTYGLPDPCLTEQWRRKLSEREIRLVESRISNMLLERGYKLSGLPPLAVSAMEIKRLRLQDWWARVLFRVRRYGLVLFLSDYISRRLGLKQWQKKTKLRINTVNTNLLK